MMQKQMKIEVHIESLYKVACMRQIFIQIQLIRPYTFYRIENFDFFIFLRGKLNKNASIDGEVCSLRYFSNTMRPDYFIWRNAYPESVA